MHRRHSSVIALVLCCAVIPVVAGCARVEKRFAPKPRIVTQEATAAAVSAEVSGTPVEGMPADLPLWPGASVDDSDLASAASGKVYEITLSTGDAYDDVLKGTAAGFESAGWQFDTTDVSSGDLKASMLTVTKGDTSGVATVSETADGRVTIAYVINLAE